MIKQVLAQAVSKTVENPLKGAELTSFAKIFGLAMNIVLGIGISLTVIYLIFGGIQYIMSRGDQKATQEARNSLTNAVIGFIVVIGAFTIKTVLSNAIGATDVVSQVVPTF